MVAKNDSKRRIEWIDIAKAFAIIAVMVDHTGGILYKNTNIAYLSYCSVGIFIMLMGITVFWSIEKKNFYLGKRCWRIFGPYLVATFIYSVLRYDSFNLEEYIKCVIYFNASSPLYYIILYVQLLLICPIIFEIINIRTKNVILGEMIKLVFIIVVSGITTNFTNIFSIYGGGGKLFGGNYLFLLYVGMMFGKYYYTFNINRNQSFVLLLSGLTLTVLFGGFLCKDRFLIDSYFPFGDGKNPPGISLCSYILSVFMVLFSLGNLMSFIRNTFLMRIFGIMGALGKHTLYIFLYHRLFIDNVFPKLTNYFNCLESNIWIKRIVYFFGMIVGSLLLEFLLEKISKNVYKAYRLNCMDGKKGTV